MLIINYQPIRLQIGISVKIMVFTIFPLQVSRYLHKLSIGQFLALRKPDWSCATLHTLIIDLYSKGTGGIFVSQPNTEKRSNAISRQNC